MVEQESKSPQDLHRSITKLEALRQEVEKLLVDEGFQTSCATVNDAIGEALETMHAEAKRLKKQERSFAKRFDIAKELLRDLGANLHLDKLPKRFNCRMIRNFPKELKSN